MQYDPGPRQTNRRLLALILAFGALVVLLISTALTSQAFVTKIGHSSLDDFAGGKFSKTGLLDIPEQEIESVHLLPIGLVGDWVAGRSLPEGEGGRGAERAVAKKDVRAEHRQNADDSRLRTRNGSRSSAVTRSLSP